MSTGRNIHKCPSCNQTYLGNVCESCFESAPGVEQTAFIKEYLKDFDQYHDKKYAPIPGDVQPFKSSSFSAPIISASLPDPRGGSIYMNNDNIDVSEIPVEKPTLILYEVSVYVKRPFALGAASTHKEVLVVLLATDSEEAMQYAEKSQGVTKVGDRAKSKWTEIRGPFKNGSVLSARDKDV